MFTEMGNEVFKHKKKFPSFYDSESYDSFLKKYFGDKKLSDYGVENGYPYVIVSSCKANLIPLEPFLFTNFITNVYKNDSNVTIFQAGITNLFKFLARATSSIPVYFDPFFIDNDIYVDGNILK
jgi:hypothetical protein